MKIKPLTIFLICLFLSSFTVPVIACCEGDPPGDYPHCYECEAGVWVLKAGLECGSDSDCEPCQVCNSDDCFCDDLCWGCQECIETCCISCEGHGKVCCDDAWCEEACEEEDDETMCSSANDRECIACVGILGGCSSYTTDIYTNNTTYDCSGGCLGDCDDVQGPVCYRTYECKTVIRYTFAECTSMSEMGPVPLDCYPTEVMPWQCSRCGPNYEELGYTDYAPSRRCQ